MATQLRQDIESVQYWLNDEEELDRGNTFADFLLDHLDFCRINAALAEQGLAFGRPGGKLAIGEISDEDVWLPDIDDNMIRDFFE